MNKVWGVTIKVLMVFSVIIGVVFLSSCGARHCSDIEWLGNSSCR